ncbi:hypothetical protein BTA51_26800 [Hahella sp. CCB-MM4]|uniref:hypothetical protein n=1 Tax=Hahella sp. (strain CCB-MM4) TaxID=1926491 RepID=UPI000B9C1FE8|nr:hypothetical protein [Hahella sp. CCB-MM4]OZG70327.1 hypothetical protein BTA51_26800 [Hahella sp. CCB-MM4]
MLNREEVHNALERVANSGLVDTPVDDLVMVALAVWHEGFVPDEVWAKRLDSMSQLVVGYVVKFLSRFNVLCAEEYEKLQQFSAKLKPSTPPQVKPDEYRDDLATAWGLEHDLTPYFKHISHYQTRHYVHESNYKRPSPNFVL